MPGDPKHTTQQAKPYVIVFEWKKLVIYFLFVHKSPNYKYGEKEALNILVRGNFGSLVKKSRSNTRGHLGCSRKSTKVQGPWLPTQRPMSVDGFEHIEGKL